MVRKKKRKPKKEKDPVVEEEEEEDDDIAEARRLAELQKKRIDSILAIREQRLAAEREKARQDSIARVKREQEVIVAPNEKYEEVAARQSSTEQANLEPGFYLIANVFSNDQYFQSFQRKLRVMGVEPKTFYRSLNGFKYVYLERYNTIGQARAARDSNFDGKYPDDLWILRIR